MHAADFVAVTGLGRNCGRSCCSNCSSANRDYYGEKDGGNGVEKNNVRNQGTVSAVTVAGSDGESARACGWKSVIGTVSGGAVRTGRAE
ncbi:hypothetical protein [Burkholderia pseudomallei]|uniref:hypothetical protein n=1 Tax=Burkholderia pseudomallei TaxID=28450 RepID=UPI0021F7239D|nr:hypothetical protein [Burkholderia pseudomallei]MCW0014666.1 hypothetical protein [Burkholderia pseudomallei]